jgi:uncharacterized protein YqgC (DUF456 family)
LNLLVGLAMVVGVAGTLIPILPGLLLIWTATLIYGIFGGFDLVAWVAITAESVIAVSAMTLSVRIPHRRTSDAGVGLPTQLMALGFAVVGFFAIPFAGAPIGFVAGVFVMRWARTRDGGEAWKGTKAALIAMWQTSAVQLLAGILMLAVWVVWALVT